jgi:hypothetical protein
MPWINQRLLKALEIELNLKPRMVYGLIAREATDQLIDRHLAAILLARKHGININKYASTEELAAIRGVQQRQPSPAIPNISSHSSKPVRFVDPVSIDLSFVNNIKLRSILSRDIKELNLASSQGLEKFPKTCIILSGSIAEALLLNSLGRRKKNALTIASSLPKKPSNNLEEWDLYDLVLVASKISPQLLSEDTIAGATQLRKWRNLIHPGRELRDSRSNKISPTKARARNAIAFLQLIGEELSK